MVYGLRRYDLERCRAVADSMALERQRYSDTESESATSPTTRKLKVDPVLVSRAKRRRQRKRRMVRESGIQPLHSLDEDDHGYYCKLEGHQVQGFFSYKSKVYLVGRFSFCSLDGLFTRELHRRTSVTIWILRLQVWICLLGRRRI
jgi:hypothetical protein